MNFDIMKHSGIKVFRIHNPRATSVIAPEFRELLTKEINTYPSEIIAIDFSKVDYIDSSFIGSLVAAYKESTKNNVAMKLFGTQERVESTFESTRLYTLFEIYKNFTQLKKTLEK
jgi:anti-sigma B factor antagonist